MGTYNAPVRGNRFEIDLAGANVTLRYHQDPDNNMVSVDCDRPVVFGERGFRHVRTVSWADVNVTGSYSVGVVSGGSTVVIGNRNVLGFIPTDRQPSRDSNSVVISLPLRVRNIVVRAAANVSNKTPAHLDDTR